MTDSTPNARPSRRRLLRVAGVFGLAATAIAADQIARPVAARANDGDSLILGSLSNTSSSSTILTDNDPNANYGLYVSATGKADAAIAGQTDTGGAGVIGTSNTSATGVWGASQDGWGVYATSTTNTGLQAGSTHGMAVVATSATGGGLYGQSGNTDGFQVTQDGVRGFSDGSGAGVRGEHAVAGAGVAGLGGPSSGVGVSGRGGGSAGHGVTGLGGGTGAGMWGTGGASGGPGVRGTAASAAGAGVLAENTAGGPALQVSGPAVFSRSGTLTVAAGSAKATKTGVALTSASLVLAVLQQHATGVYVLAAVPNVSGRSLTIYLSKAVSVATKVAWFVVN